MIAPDPRELTIKVGVERGRVWLTTGETDEPWSHDDLGHVCEERFAIDDVAERAADLVREFLRIAEEDEVYDPDGEDA